MQFSTDATLKYKKPFYTRKIMKKFLIPQSDILQRLLGVPCSPGYLYRQEGNAVVAEKRRYVGHGIVSSENIDEKLEQKKKNVAKFPYSEYRAPNFEILWKRVWNL
jgi:hypothetical protein